MLLQRSGLKTGTLLAGKSATRMNAQRTLRSTPLLVKEDHTGNSTWVVSRQTYTHTHIYIYMCVCIYKSLYQRWMLLQQWQCRHTQPIISMSLGPLVQPTWMILTGFDFRVAGLKFFWGDDSAHLDDLAGHGLSGFRGR